MPAPLARGHHPSTSRLWVSGSLIIGAAQPLSFWLAYCTRGSVFKGRGIVCVRVADVPRPGGPTVRVVWGDVDGSFAGSEQLPGTSVVP